MAAPAIDAGLDHLEAFNALLGETNDRLHEAIAALEAHEEDVGGLAERTDDEIEASVAVVVETGGRADRLQEDVVAAAGDLAERAAEVGGRRLTDLGAAVESLEHAVGERCSVSRDALGRDADRLDHDGFDPIGEALESADAAIGAAHHETGLAFDEPTGALEALEVRLSDLRFDMDTALREAVDRLEHEDAKGLEEVRSACAVEWPGGIEDSLRKRCAELQGEMEVLYDACFDEVEAEGESLVAGAAALLKAAAREALAGQAAALAASVAYAHEGMEALQAELEALLALMDAEKVTAESVPSLVAGLKPALAVVDELKVFLEGLAR